MEGPQAHPRIPNHRKRLPRTPAARDVESLQVMVDFLSSDDFSTVFCRYSASLTRALGYSLRLVHDDKAELQSQTRST